MKYKETLSWILDELDANGKETPYDEEKFKGTYFGGSS